MNDRSAPNWHASLLDRLSTPLGAACLCLFVALAARAVQFGNPVIHVDDQFYLFVGDRMWQGAMPYRDIWDRKPVGLFLIFAAIRALGGEGVVQYQLVATAFALSTALVIRTIARRIAGPRGATAAAVIYLTALGISGGDGGQSPVFYNLPVALAVLATLAAVARERFDSRAMMLGSAAMLLMGIAIQIKYTVLFEGGFLGLVLLWRAHRSGHGWAAISTLALGWMILGLAPTGLAWGYFAAAGLGPDFVYANFTSIFDRRKEPVDVVLGRLAAIAIRLAPLSIAAWFGIAGARQRNPDETAILSLSRHVITGWTLTAVGAVLLFGSYFDHYALPLLVPLTVAAAPLLGDPHSGIALIIRDRRRTISIAAFLIIATSIVTISTSARFRKERGTGPEVRAMAAYLKPRLKDCLFIYEGDVILYMMTKSCLPTRWPFPDHLNNKREVGAIGVDVMTEVRRIMAKRPTYVVSRDAPQSKSYVAGWDEMQTILARDYRQAARWRVGPGYRIIYERLPGH
ncbi:hypothetical protein G4G27_18185 [Sphingomonas sp. So64.6b]|uniref:ArnT family glycosyltransferase n=1 Tax=Sphingomonas sp. So64.6b TaxID=2997354 RepID=UPI0015FF7E47|nr:hypothetical protein [Sphingomonas sp. So64.6b]QNA85694.1 hypothetical protein G4G27_18185 [Sphingomonas sp. So64.6b]